jgi:hypothetical protein
MKTKEQLLAMKNQIEAAKTKEAEKKGSLHYQLIQLKEQYGCNTIQEAQKMLDELDAKSRSLQQQFDKGVQELEKKYDLKEE